MDKTKHDPDVRDKLYTLQLENDLHGKRCIRCHQPGREDGSLMHVECREELRKKLYGEEGRA